MYNENKTKFSIKLNIAQTAIESAISTVSEYIDDEVTKEIIDDLQYAIFDIMSAKDKSDKFNVFKEKC